MLALYVFSEDALIGAEVFVGDNFNPDTFNPADADALSKWQRCIKIPAKASTRYDFDCDRVTKGRYLVVLFRDNKERSLSVCEVEAFEKASKSSKNTVNITLIGIIQLKKAAI